MRLWLEFLAVGGLLWMASLHGVHPTLRLVGMAAALVWGAVTATRPSRIH